MNKHQKNVQFPSFELIGPPCLDKVCEGTLVLCLDKATKKFFERCSVCQKERRGKHRNYSH